MMLSLDFDFEKVTENQKIIQYFMFNMLMHVLIQFLNYLN